jgi:hypothetical protein
MKCEFCRIEYSDTVSFDDKTFCSIECSFHYEVTELKSKVDDLKAEVRFLKEKLNEY